jgi:ferredoxin
VSAHSPFVSAAKPMAIQVKVIESRCQGHARCAAVGPELFDLDDEGYSFVVPGCETIADDDEETLETAQLAVENCPEQAIELESRPTDGPAGRPAP